MTFKLIIRLQDMDSMVGITLTIEKEIEDARGIRAANVMSPKNSFDFNPFF